MSQLPPLPPELGRFDSIVDAHNAGDRQAYQKAIETNARVTMDIIFETIRRGNRYQKQLDALNQALKEVKSGN